MCPSLLTCILLEINCKRIGAHSILRINKTGKQSESCMDFTSSMWNHNGYICLGWCSRTFSCIYLLHMLSRGRPCRDRWSWSYNYLCNQCLSPLNLWFRTPFMERCTRYNNMWYNVSVTCDRWVVFSAYSSFPCQ
jgi:hypothetical protein